MRVFFCLISLWANITKSLYKVNIVTAQLLYGCHRFKAWVSSERVWFGKNTESRVQDCDDTRQISSELWRCLFAVIWKKLINFRRVNDLNLKCLDSPPPFDFPVQNNENEKLLFWIKSVVINLARIVIDSFGFEKTILLKLSVAFFMNRKALGCKMVDICFSSTCLSSLFSYTNSISEFCQIS